MLGLRGRCRGWAEVGADAKWYSLLLLVALGWSLANVSFEPDWIEDEEEVCGCWTLSGGDDRTAWDVFGEFCVACGIAEASAWEEEAACSSDCLSSSSRRNSVIVSRALVNVSMLSVKRWNSWIGERMKFTRGCVLTKEERRFLLAYRTEALSPEMRDCSYWHQPWDVSAFSSDHRESADISADLYHVWLLRSYPRSCDESYLLDCLTMVAAACRNPWEPCYYCCW